MDAIILAGGLGTRLRAAVPDVPKPMAPIAGRPFLAWLIEYWVALGGQRLILSVGYKHEAIRKYFGDAWGGCPVRYAIESQPLGTGGGLLLALTQLTPRAATLVLNGDTFFDVSLAALRDAHGQHKAAITLALTGNRVPGRFSGVELDASGRILNLAARSGTAAPIVNGGVYLLDPAALSGETSGVRLSFEDDVLPRLIASGARVQGLVASGRFIDIGVPKDYRRCQDWFGKLPGARVVAAKY